MLPINIYTFVHDTVMMKDNNHLKFMFFDIFTPELSKITKRTINVKFIYDTPGITDFNYLTYDSRYSTIEPFIEAISADIKTAIYTYMTEHRRPARPTDIYLILIDGYLSVLHNVQGMAVQNARIAFATTFGRTVVAHELGHCFGATHEHTDYYAEPERNDRYGCATFMVTKRREGTCALFRYSDKNREHIRKYFSQLD